jgi:SAM-dependent methyltransferase
MTKDAATEWAGEKGRFWAEHADRFSRMLADFGTAVIDAADLATGERVLDVGCGGGDVALAAAQAVGPDGAVLGVDLSAEELDVARVRAAQRGVDNVEFREADASTGDLGPQTHDVLTSRFGVMFFTDPVAAFTHLRSAVRPGGRLAFVCWQGLDDNEWTAVPREAIGSALPLTPPPPADTPGGFAFRDPDRVRSILEGAGWSGVDLADTRGTVHLGTSVEEALAFVQQMGYAKAALDQATTDQVTAALDRVRAALRPRAGADGGIELAGRVWLVRARA